MTIVPAEFSGLLDGELPPGRAAIVRAAIDADPVLAAEYRALGGDDLAWRRAAATAAFAPRVVLGVVPYWETSFWIAALLAALLGLRAVSDLHESWPWIALVQGPALIVALVWLARMAGRAEGIT